MHLKDYVTLGNLLCGFLAIIAVIRGHFHWACYLVLIGYIFDVLDGLVARLTRKFDDFGGELDSICDFVTYSIAPSFIIFQAFSDILGWPDPLAALVAAAPICLGTIRQAKYAVSNLSYPCYWIGLPRPVLSLSILALLNSSWFTSVLSPPWRSVTAILAAALILIFSALHLAKIPFVNHHQRRWMGALKFGFAWFLITTPLAALLGLLLLDTAALVFDMLLANMIVYVFVSWVMIPREDLRRIRIYTSGGAKHLPLVHISLNPPQGPSLYRSEVKRLGGGLLRFSDPNDAGPPDGLVP